MATRVVMLVKNSFEFDARVLREASTLVDEGYDVTVVALRSAATPAEETLPSGVRVRRVEAPLADVGRRGRALAATESTATPGDTVAARGTARPRTFQGSLRRVLRAAAAATRPVRHWLLDRAMTRVALALRPDVVHAHDLNTLVAGAVVADRAGARLVYDTHELAAGRNLATARQSRRAAALEARLVPRADAVITASPGYTAELASRLRCAPITILNVPELVDPIPAATPLPRRPGARLAVYVGSIQPNRGIETAIGALVDAPDWDLAVVGYGSHRPDLEALAASSGLSERVHFTGPVPHEDLIATAATADAGLCLIVGTARSYELSVPNKLFEYFAAGIPVVAADLPAIRDVVGRTAAAVLVDPTDVTSVARILREMPEDGESPGDWPGAQGRELHLTRFHWERERTRLSSIYDDLTAT